MPEEASGGYPFKDAKDFGYARDTYRPYRDWSKEHLEKIGHDTKDYFAIKETGKLLMSLGKDPVTGLPNTNGFQELVAKEVPLAEREGLPVSVLLGDANGLKRINDTQGHKAGDLYLRKIGQILGIGNRPSDIVARVGGDEFKIVLIGTDLEGAQKWLDNKIPALKDADVSLSIGIAQVDMKNPKGAVVACAEALEDADLAMYKAKEESNHEGIKFEVYKEPIPATA